MARVRFLSIVVRFVVCVLIVASGVGVYAALRQARPQPGRSDREGDAPRVRVMEARSVPVQRQWQAFGTARALDSANVPARVTTTVSRLPETIVVGAQVDEGELLALLDDSDFQRREEIATQAIAELEAQLARLDVELESWKQRVELADQLVELAQAEFDRVVEAQRRDAARQREVDIARQALVSAIRDQVGAREQLDALLPNRTGLEARKLGQEAEQRLARQNIDRCRVLSPITGVLETVDIEVGENVASGQRVARVVDLSRIEVALRLPAAARSSIRAGDDVEVRATGGDDRRWRAVVSRLSPSDDAETRTMGVFVEIEQDPERSDGLAPGRFLRASVRSSHSEPRIIVPRRALDGERVLLVRDGVIVSRPVEVGYDIEGVFPQFGLDDEQWVVLRGGLEEGSLVLVNARRALPDGMHVEPYGIEREATAARRAPDEVPP